jgi:glycosyltransferase involved in cell wall biosynthesis
MKSLSILIPIYNEEDSLQALFEELKSSFENNQSIEIIFINDGSSDMSQKVIENEIANHSTWKLINLYRNYGKSVALQSGIDIASNELIATLDGDLQDDPKEIIPLYKMITENNYDIVSGWKKKRYDSLIFKNLPSKLFNFAARLSSGISLNDFNCGIKAYKSDVIKEIELTSGMHRYIPVLAKKSGFNKIAEKIVKHHPRLHGNTKYGPDRFIKGFLDLITLSFFSRFGKRPMHFFGLFGTLILVVGFFFSIYLGIDKLFINTSGRLITERPEFYISLASMIIGSQFFLAGFLGELILRNSKKAKNYKIKSRLNNE